MSLVSSYDRIYATRVLYLLLMPFDKQKAFKLGLIDGEGNKLKTPETETERQYYTELHRLCFEVKKLINRVPGAEFRLKMVAVALQLMRRRAVPSMFLDGLVMESFKGEYLSLLEKVNGSLIEEEVLIEDFINAIPLSEDGEGGVTNSVSGIAPVAEPVIKRKKLEESDKQPVYVSRRLINTDDLISWAKAQGFAETVNPDDLHVTLAFSRDPVDMSTIIADTQKISISTDGRTVEPLGDKGAVVLKFKSSMLQSRWKALRNLGCSWDYESYQPHVTITYKETAGLDLSKVTPFEGTLHFDKEMVEPLDLDWGDKVKHDSLTEDTKKYPAGHHDSSLVPDGDMGSILNSDSDNIALRHVRKFAPNYSLDEKHPVSSLVHQYAIGKAFELASSGNEDYKKSVFDSYKQHKPQLTSGVSDYDGLVNKTYAAAVRDTKSQFKALPVETEYHNGEHEYHNSMEMVKDVHKNRHMFVFSGGEPHTHLTHDPETGLTANEQFRAVHDMAGHAVHGNQFGPIGEEVAWNIHRQMYSDDAKPAVTAETRGQNSQVNYTLHNYDNISEMRKHRKLASEATNQEDRDTHIEKVKSIGKNFNYAKQVAAVLPHEMNEPDYDGTVPHSIAHLLKDNKFAGEPYDSEKDHLGIVKLAKLYHPDNAHEVTTKLAKVHGYSSVTPMDIKESFAAVEHAPEEVYTHIHNRITRNFTF